MIACSWRLFRLDTRFAGLSLEFRETPSTKINRPTPPTPRPKAQKPFARGFACISSLLTDQEPFYAYMYICCIHAKNTRYASVEGATDIISAFSSQVYSNVHRFDPLVTPPTSGVTTLDRTSEKRTPSTHKTTDPLQLGGRGGLVRKTLICLKLQSRLRRCHTSQTVDRDPL